MYTLHQYPSLKSLIKLDVPIKDIQNKNNLCNFLLIAENKKNTRKHLEK